MQVVTLYDKKLIQNIWIVFLALITYDVLFDVRHTSKLDEIQSSIPAIKSIASKKKVSALEGYFLILIMPKERIERVATEVEKVQQKFPSSINDSFYIKALELCSKIEYEKSFN